MAPVPLNISPAFRRGVRPGSRICSSTTKSGSVFWRAGTRAVRSRASRPARPAAQCAATARGAPPASAAFLYPSPPAAARFQRPAKNCADRGHGTLAPDAWPAYWQTLLKKTPPRPSLVWSYPSLSRDLGGDADAAHRDFLRRLLGDMALPKGSHAFWPLNRYPYGDGESEQTVDARMFLSGIAALKPESVILMCGQVPPELGLADLRPLSPSIVHGHRYVVTPHVDDLIGEPQRYAQLITFLKSIIAGR